MTRNELFTWLVLSMIMCISGVREIVRRNYGFGCFMIGIPACAWLSLFGKA